MCLTLSSDNSDNAVVGSSSSIASSAVASTMQLHVQALYLRD